MRRYCRCLENWRRRLSPPRRHTRIRTLLSPSKKHGGNGSVDKLPLSFRFTLCQLLIDSVSLAIACIHCHVLCQTTQIQGDAALESVRFQPVPANLARALPVPPWSAATSASKRPRGMANNDTPDLLILVYGPGLRPP